MVQVRDYLKDMGGWSFDSLLLGLFHFPLSFLCEGDFNILLGLGPGKVLVQFHLMTCTYTVSQVMYIACNQNLHQKKMRKCATSTSLHFS